MLFIVVYHLFLFFVAPHYPTEIFYKAIQIPLHIGVILFVLISGYWGIKCNLKGLFNLVFMIVVYYLPIAIFTYFSISGRVSKQLLKDFLFISHTPYWFIRTYICLYLFSPVLNKYLESTTEKQRFILIVALVFMSVYIGTSHGDPTLSDGKNLINFSLLYVLGNTLRIYEHNWKQWNNRLIILIYCGINILLVTLYCTFENTIISTIIWRISFPYCSPILIINAMLLFIIISRFQLHSKQVNYIASSMLAVYLIHCHPFVETYVIGSFMNRLLLLSHDTFIVSILTLLLGIVILLSCVLIDKFLTPLWRVSSRHISRHLKM